MGWLRDFRDEWTQPGYAHGKMAGLCRVGSILCAVWAAVASGALMIRAGDPGWGSVVTLWVFAGVFEIAARVYVILGAQGDRRRRACRTSLAGSALREAIPPGNPFRVGPDPHGDFGGGSGLAVVPRVSAGVVSGLVYVDPLRSRDAPG